MTRMTLRGAVGDGSGGFSCPKDTGLFPASTAAAPAMRSENGWGDKKAEAMVRVRFSYRIKPITDAGPKD
jgi:hypothetical protein